MRWAKFRNISCRGTYLRQQCEVLRTERATQSTAGSTLRIFRGCVVRRFRTLRIDSELALAPKAIFKSGSKGVESSFLLGLKERLLDIRRLLDKIIGIGASCATTLYTSQLEPL